MSQYVVIEDNDVVYTKKYEYSDDLTSIESGVVSNEVRIIRNEIYRAGCMTLHKKRLFKPNLMDVCWSKLFSKTDKKVNDLIKDQELFNDKIQIMLCGLALKISKLEDKNEKDVVSGS